MQILLIQGDLTTRPVDAIVNAANSGLTGGGGVDGAIHRAGGPAILEECRQIVASHGPCPVGEAVITTAGALPAKKVIHTVGPKWVDGAHNEEKRLAACYRNALDMAVQYGLKTIAFPNISTGVYGYPKDAAARVALSTIRSYPADRARLIERVELVCFDQENYQLYSELLEADPPTGHTE